MIKFIKIGYVKFLVYICIIDINIVVLICIIKDFGLGIFDEY